MRLDEGDYLAHYGILRKSGRYPWGSGANPHQRSKTFLAVTEEMRKSGMSDAKIAEAFSDKENGFPFTTADLRALRSRAVNEVKQEQIRTAQKLKDKGMGYSEIARQMSTPEKAVNESTVRSLLAPGRQEKLDQLQATADMLKRQVAEKGYIDVGAQVERDLPIGDNPNVRVGISRDKFQTAISMLKEEGYSVHPVKIRQLGTGEMTSNLVLSKEPQTKAGQKTVFLNKDKIQLISEGSPDGGRTWEDLKPPLNISSKRVAVRYKEDGGADADGVIYVRPGVKDISLGKSHYAQVRIGIDGTHYLKGMAIYKDDLPKGVDLLFNTNKSNTGNKLDAMKPQKTDDPKNPFGAAIKVGGQIKDKHGNVTSAMNIINEQGDWDKWSKNISRQVLSKQSPDMAEKQLEYTYERRRAELEEIKALTNPLIRQKLLDTFGDETDSAAVHLKAASMPRQAQKVLLPSNHVKPNEVFAPTFRNGERVVLIRYPHAGRFEIPELVVNNRSPEAAKLMGGRDAPDAIAIHPKVAERLSGADFDGDSVVVIPNNRGQIKTAPALEGLKNFDPLSSYGPYDGMKTIDGGTYHAATREVDYGRNKDGSPKKPRTSTKQHEMGNVTNLIADMTLKGANNDELARAVRHSMVVIDSEKHVLDYKASERDNGIRDLKRRYQGVHPKTGQPRGASTLITRATAETREPMRKARPADQGGAIDRATGRKMYVPTGQVNLTFKDASGTKQVKGFSDHNAAEAYAQEHGITGHKIETKTYKTDRLAVTEDAHTLVSEPGGTRIEHIYADHSNRLKALANEARKEAVNMPPIKRNISASRVYAEQVKSLDHKLNIALKNAPLERHAQVVANTIVGQRKRANPGMDPETERKIKGQALNEARIRTGAGKARIVIEPKEWEAIQAGALSKNKLGHILRNTDVDKLRKLATPHQNPVMTTALQARARSMLASGYSLAEVADHLDVALSTLKSSVEKGGA